MSPQASTRVEFVIRKKKPRAVIHQLKNPGAKNTRTSHSYGQSHGASAGLSPGPSRAASRSKSSESSPSAERISQALKTQLLPTNKEMSSFRMSLVSS